MFPDSSTGSWTVTAMSNTVGSLDPLDNFVLFRKNNLHDMVYLQQPLSVDSTRTEWERVQIHIS